MAYFEKNDCNFYRKYDYTEKFGKHGTCDYCFQYRNIKLDPYYDTYSNFQFTISVSGSHVVISDEKPSKNGVFLNNHRVKPGKKEHMTHGDVIYLCRRDNPIFVYLNAKIPKTTISHKKPTSDEVIDYFVDPHALGAGSYGVVHRAWSLDPEQTYAVKVAKSRIDCLKTRIDVTEEIKILPKINHPCIVQVKSLFY